MLLQFGLEPGELPPREGPPVVERPKYVCRAMGWADGPTEGIKVYLSKNRKNWPDSIRPALIRFVTMLRRELTIEIARRRGAQWYLMPSGRYLLTRDFGEAASCPARGAWPGPIRPWLTTCWMPTPSPTGAATPTRRSPWPWSCASSRATRTWLSVETDEAGQRRWLALFRKSHAYAWGDTPAEAMCRAYLLAYEMAL